MDAYAEHPDQINLSPYVYVADNPVDKTDPDGNCWPCIVIAIEVAEDLEVLADDLLINQMVGTVTQPTVTHGRWVTQQGGIPSSSSTSTQTNDANAHNTKAQTNQTGSIYKVPGHATKSGKPYIGRHNKPNPQKTRKSNDGRDRKQAKVIDNYDPKNIQEGRTKEQQAIDDNGGIDKLDNKRNEIKKDAGTPQTPSNSQDNNTNPPPAPNQQQSNGN